jgi:hypothetical protein
MEDGCFISPKISFDDSEPGNRKVICKQEISEGELLIEENFILTGLYSANCMTACHFCLAEGPEMKRCSNCKYSHYCSADHQTLDWKRGHKKECAILKTMTQEGKRQPTAPLMLALKAFVQIDLLKNASLAKNLEALKHHPEKMTSETHEELKGNIVLIIKYSDNNFDLERLEKYIRFQDKMLINGVTVYCKADPRNSLAMGLLNHTCRVNHSCEPNAFGVFNPFRGNRLVGARTIHPGEEITFSYVSTLAKVQDRQAKLREEYHFECQCAKCKREEADLKLQPPSKFNKEQLRRPLNSMEEVKTFLAEVGKELKEYDTDWYEVLETVEPAVIGLTQYEFLYQFRKTFTKKFENWFKGIMMNPVVAQHYCHLAKLANYLGKVEKSYVYSTEALRIFRKFFVGQEVKDLELMQTDAKNFLELQQKKSLK